MMLYVYGVVDSPQFSAAVSGHEGAIVFPVACGDLAAAASKLSGAVEPEVQHVWRHERVLELLMQEHAVLPLRFGTCVSDVDTVCGELQRRRPALLEGLARVRGRAEFALRVAGIMAGHSSVASSDDRASSPLPGTRYLQAKAKIFHERALVQAAARRVRDTLQPYLDGPAVAAVWGPGDGASAELTASCLVDRDNIPQFIHAVEEVRRNHRALDVTCSGPWAPYSFVSMRAAEAER
ncbi:MAG: GvpL/GvpF family gas vesicle protein [Xanthobacteraceae bacterium]|nr:GvpL/GvpF family gas vesicle protein [Xanthobacteraceae bacterium]MBV9631071.1 GvpL/GvpF family gas vesicle protein [Xanthobacteraceae bacterium]